MPAISKTAQIRIPLKRYSLFRVLPPQAASPVSTAVCATAFETRAEWDHLSDVAWSPRLGLGLSCQTQNWPSVSEGLFLVSRFLTKGAALGSTTSAAGDGRLHRYYGRVFSKQTAYSKQVFSDE
jgi:hypothetical protein